MRSVSALLNHNISRKNCNRLFCGKGKINQMRIVIMFTSLSHRRASLRKFTVNAVPRYLKDDPQCVHGLILT